MFAKHLINSYILGPKGGCALARPPFISLLLLISKPRSTLGNPYYVPNLHASGGGIRKEAMHDLRSLDRSLLHDRLTRKQRNSYVLIAKCVKYLPSTEIGNRLANRFAIHYRRLKILAKHTKAFVLACILLYSVCTPFGLRLYRSGC